MESNYVCLQFAPVVTRLAGYDYGKEIFQSQVENRIDFSCQATIEFPERIVKIASSFVQGFFENIINQAGLDKIGSQIIIKTRSSELTSSILNNLV